MTMRELRRVVFSRAALFMLLLLTAIGAVLFRLRITSSVVDKRYPEVYTRVYHELIEEFGSRDPAAVDPQEIEDRSRAASVKGSIVFHLNYFGRDETFEEMLEEYPEYREALENGELQKYVDEPLLSQAERDALGTISDQLAYLAGFNEYYPYIKKNAERMQRTSLFGDPNSFSYRNLIKTVKDFEPIDGAVGELGDDRAVTSVFDDPIADYLMLVFMAAVSVIMLKERRSGLWQLVRASKNGRGRLALERTLTLFVCAFLATLFIFGSRIAVSYYTYDGLRYGGRLIQSVSGFNGIPIPMKVNTFVLLYSLVKVICTFFAGLLVWLMLSSIKNINLAIAVTAAVLAAEYTFYSTVRDSSILVPFKYVNIFQLIVPRGFVVSYLNLNFFEHPLNTRAAVSIVMSALSLLAAVGIILIHVFKRPAGRPNPIEKLLDRIRRLTYKCVFMQETGKALFFERAIIVVLILFYVFSSFGSLPGPTVTDEQKMAAGYYERYAGSVSEETLASIDEDIEKLEGRLGEVSDSIISMSIRKTVEGLYCLRDDVEDIIARNASGEYPREIKLLPPFTYMIVFGTNSKRFEVNQGMKALLLISLFAAGLYAYEKQSRMTKLLRSLPRGRGRLFLRKELLTLAFSALVFLAVYLPEILAAAKPEPYGGFAYFSYPAQGLGIMRESHLSLSVGGLVILFYAIRFLMIFLTGSAIGLVSALTDRVNTSLVASCAVFALPACIAAMGVDSIFDFTPLPLLWVSGAMFYHEGAKFAAVSAVLLVMAAVNFVINCAVRTPLRGRSVRITG